MVHCVSSESAIACRARITDSAVKTAVPLVITAWLVGERVMAGGTVEDAGGAARLLALVSRSAVHHIGAAGQTTRTKLLVEQLDGHDLGGVPLSFRSTFVPPGLRTVRLPQGCRWTSSAP